MRSSRRRSHYLCVYNNNIIVSSIRKRRRRVLSLNFHTIHEHVSFIVIIVMHTHTHTPLQRSSSMIFACVYTWYYILSRGRFSHCSVVASTRRPSVMSRRYFIRSVQNPAGSHRRFSPSTSERRVRTEWVRRGRSRKITDFWEDSTCVRHNNTLFIVNTAAACERRKHNSNPRYPYLEAKK